MILDLRWDTTLYDAACVYRADDWWFSPYCKGIFHVYVLVHFCMYLYTQSTLSLPLVVGGAAILKQCKQCSFFAGIDKVSMIDYSAVSFYALPPNFMGTSFYCLLWD